MTIERKTFWSLEEFANAAKEALSGKYKGQTVKEYLYTDHPVSDRFSGGSFEKAFQMARDGWPEALQEAMPLVQSALQLVKQEEDYQTFTSVYDVTGSEVDIDRYLMGVPEDMIEYEPITVSRVGRVITLCAGMSVSGSVTDEGIKRRGAAITALAMALQQCGHAVELWADFTNEGHDQYYRRNGSKAVIRVLVKGARDVVDPARIAYAYGHASVLRRLKWAVCFGFPAEKRKAVYGIGNAHPHMGTPHEPIKDLPEGTIYLDSLKTETDVPNPEQFVMAELRKIGLIPEG